MQHKNNNTLHVDKNCACVCFVDEYLSNCGVVGNVGSIVTWLVNRYVSILSEGHFDSLEHKQKHDNGNKKI
jgi:hypothetical protein